jgi:hypothetical protein
MSLTGRSRTLVSMSARRAACLAIVSGAIAIGLVPSATPSAHASNADSHYGVNPDSDGPPALQYLQDAGFKWARLFVHWGDAGDNGKYPGMEHDGYGKLNLTYLAQMDATVNDLVNNRHFSVDIVLNRIPTWAYDKSNVPQSQMCKSEFPKFRPPKSSGYFGNFMREMAQHFKGRVAAWELWNEPNPDEHCGFPGSAGEFQTLMLEPGYAAVKAEDPNALVLGPALGGDTIAQDLWSYYTTKLPNGQRVLDRPLDGASVHAYNSLSHVQDVMNTANNFHPCTADGHCLGKYWLTEFGFDNIADPDGSKSVQVFQTCDTQSNCGKAFYFDVDTDVNYALFTSNHDGSVTPRNKYYAIKNYVVSHTPLLTPSNPNAPTVGSDTSGTQYVFWKGADNNLWELLCPPSAQGCLGPIALGFGPLGSQPAVTVDRAGHQYVFWKGADSNLWESFWDGTRWIGPMSRGGAPLGSTPTVASDASGYQFVFWEGTDNNVWETLCPPSAGPCLGPVLRGFGPVASAPTVTIDAAGRQYLYWKGTDNNLWESFWDGTRWIGPMSRGGGPLGSEPTVGSNTAGVQFVFWKGTDNNVWEIMCPPSASPCYGPAALGFGPLGSAPAVTVDRAGHQYVFWKGTDNNLWESFWDGARWNGPMSRGAGPLG